jgi:hypothetical protein
MEETILCYHSICSNFLTSLQNEAADSFIALGNVLDVWKNLFHTNLLIRD